MRVFISRDRRQNDRLATLLEAKGVDVEFASLIKIKPCSFVLPQIDFSWIFFSSQNGVRSFFASNPDVGNVKLAAIGPATASVVAEFGRVDFVGNENDIKAVGSKFAEIIGNDTALFPISKSSLRTAQKHLPAAQVIDLVCYETIADTKSIPACEGYIFTSPSNVRSFAKANKFDLDAKYLGGPTTAEVIKEHGVGNPIALSNWEESTVMDAIFSK
jgi:uroporphyrinogen-III synthase